jgi:hypothetical protein
MRAVDQLSLGAVFKRGGLSPEASELLAIVFASETSLNTAITEFLRQAHDGTFAQRFEKLSAAPTCCRRHSPPA